MRRAISISVFLIALSASRALPQQATSPGAIEGVIVRADTGEPIAGARVSLAPAGAADAPSLAAGSPIMDDTRPSYRFQGVTFFARDSRLPGSFQPVTTGSDGKFSFRDIRAGTYRLAAGADGYISLEFGQKSPRDSARLLFLRPGEKILSAGIQLPKSATVSGQVLDENGMPASGVLVQLFGQVYNLYSRKAFQGVGSADVDDNGNYHIPDVPPGHYYLLAEATRSTHHYSSEFYPNAMDLDHAEVIDIRPGMEASFDMKAPRKVNGFNIHGRLVDETGNGLPANVNFTLDYEALEERASFDSDKYRYDSETGEFELNNIPPGDYLLHIDVRDPLDIHPASLSMAESSTVWQAAQALHPAAVVPIHVIDSDIDGIKPILRPRYSISGHIQVEGYPLPVVPHLDQVRVGLYPLLKIASELKPNALSPNPDGSFQVGGLREGEYRVAVGGQFPGFYVKSIRFGGEDVLGKPLKVFEGSGATLEVTLHTNPGRIAGTLTDVRSQPVSSVTVFAVPADRNRTDLYRTIKTDQNGRFSFQDVTPGDYRLFSWESFADTQAHGPDIYGYYESKSQRVHVSEGATSESDVRIIPSN